MQLLSRRGTVSGGLHALWKSKENPQLASSVTDRLTERSVSSMAGQYQSFDPTSTLIFRETFQKCRMIMVL